MNEKYAAVVNRYMEEIILKQVGDMRTFVLESSWGIFKALIADESKGKGVNVD